MSKIPLGQATEYPHEYAPGVLCPVSRSTARDALGIGAELPFHGNDLWNAWELTWLDSRGQPVVATATFSFDASSPNIVESKSLKLYLGSLAMTRFAAQAELVHTLSSDLEKISGGDVEVTIHTARDAEAVTIRNLPGNCVDDLPMSRWAEQVDSNLLAADNEIVTETIHSNLLRSLCPVTSQPDIGSVMVRYRGPRIEPASFLEYVVSFRQHQDFHEACVERMFLDVKAQCRPEELTVYARYNRRGGIDINPFRTDFDDEPANLRLWRQ
ncbi:MAG: NADPH-dependent 7-cyano-7-deazaguanine reductase QueF [Gammaproteobacteria bacterium]|nr:NADPH-dependent 7-cyano-7-deazaguanine reductase QueF [Gammaproteobacteria bacterium]